MVVVLAPLVTAALLAPRFPGFRSQRPGHIRPVAT